MFSVYGEEHYKDEHAEDTENVLDVLKRAGVHVLWRDNNSSSKHVADRVEYQSYMSPEVNTICDEECRDEGMLVGLQDYIDSHPTGDIAIILHQMGNHGPAYYKRYPKEFEKFTPVCRTNELAECTSQEINNAYDNAILYTDYFLSKVIALLKNNDGPFETTMFYLSDHGESLGENGIHLHGMPNFIAPEVQRHVPAVLWVGQYFDEVDVGAINKRRHKRYTQDSVFHTLLGFMEVTTKVYKKKRDLLQH
jgi:lipid A ethanolaminephosphotransferase